MDNATCCAVAGCHKPVRSRGYCYAHYMKAWRYGTPTPTHAPRYRADIIGRRFGALVVTPERDGRFWLCRCDCGGIARATPDGLREGGYVTCGNRSVHYRMDVVAYCAAHDRLRADRGSASQYPCIDCGEPAHEWSYDHRDPDELRDEKTGARYSLDQSHYSPRCIGCHRRFDDNPIARDGGRRGAATR